MAEANVYLVAYEHTVKEEEKLFQWSLHVAAKDVPAALAKAEKDAKAMKHLNPRFTDCALKVSGVLL